MDIQKEREAFLHEFEKTDQYRQQYGFYKIPLKYDEQIETWNFYDVQAAWEMWQAAKAQAVPEWISTSDRMPNEGEEVFVHYYGQISQATRDKKYSGGFKQRNCYGWEAVSSYISHWMPKSIELPEQYHFYYENDAKQKAMIEAQEPANEL